MKSGKILLILSAAVLLCGCGSVDSEPAEKTTKNTTEASTKVIVTTTESPTEPPEEKVTEPTTEPPEFPRTEPTKMSPDAIETMWEIIRSECNAEGYTYHCSAKVDSYDDKSTRHTEYESTTDSVDGIWELINGFEPMQYETASKGFTQDHSVRMDRSGMQIRLTTGLATVYGYDSLDNATVSQEPALQVFVNGYDKVVLLIPYKLKKEFDAVIEKTTVSEENLTYDYVYDHSYEEITDSYPKDNIVFVYSFSNYAWEHVHHGKFIDSSGYVYEFDFSGRRLEEEAKLRDPNAEVTYSSAFLDALYYEVYYKNSPYAKTNCDDLLDAMVDIDCIDRDAEFPLHNECCDYGSGNLYVVDGSHKLLKIDQSGDNVGHLEDKYAERLIDMFKGFEYEEIGE